MSGMTNTEAPPDGLNLYASVGLGNRDCIKPPINVLALDGGGMRGLYTASVLECVAQRYRRSASAPSCDIGRGFDLILGTSTGAILATALASGLSIAQVKTLYCEHGPKIFPDPMPPFDRSMGLRGKARFVRWCLRHAFRPGTDAKHLKVALEAIFGDQTLGGMFAERGIGLCITTTALHQHKPVVFKTGHLGPKFRRDDMKRLVDVCLASAAAPVFLPLAESNGELPGQRTVYADGGLWANNPVVVGLTEALAIADEGQPIRIFSIGTCPPPSGEVDRSLQRGLLDWKVGAGALELSMNAQAEAANEQARHLIRALRRHGHDIELYRAPETPPSKAMASLIGLDRADPDATAALIQHGAEDGTKLFQEIQQGTPGGHLLEAMLQRASGIHQSNNQLVKS